VMTIDSLKFASSASDDEDDRASHSTNVGGSSGASTARCSNSSSVSQSGSERSSPVASPAFAPAFASGCDSLSTSSYIEDSSGPGSSRSSSPSRLPGHVEALDEDVTTRREAFHRRRRLDLRSLAKVLAKGAGYDYGLIHAGFEAVDLNDHGWVSSAAFESVFVRFGVEPDVASQVFALLEQNDKGCVNYMSFMAVCGPVLQQGLRAQPRFQPPSPAPRQQEQRFGPHGWRTWRRTAAVKGQSWSLA